MLLSMTGPDFAVEICSRLRCTEKAQVTVKISVTVRLGHVFERFPV